MLNNKLKAQAIHDLHGIKAESAGGKLSTILDILINEARVANDTATEAEIKINQGEIKAYLKLKEYLERGIPTMS
jgi:hypothetical protein